MDSDSDGYSTSSSSSATIAEASAAILMLSLPDSLDDDDNNKTSADHDVFETPPEYALAGTSQDKTPLLNLSQIEPSANDWGSDEDIGDGSVVIVAVGGCGVDGDGDVDLERDAVSETESVEEFRVSKRREMSSVEPSPPSKKSRVSEEGELEKSDGELGTEQLNLSNHGSDSNQTLEIAENEDAKSVNSEINKAAISGSESKNDTSEETPPPISEEFGGQSGLEYSFHDEEGEIDSGEVLRVMPLSFCLPAEPSSSVDGEGDEWSSLLEIVKVVKDLTCKEDNAVEKCSLVEIAKRRGMTFPSAVE